MTEQNRRQNQRAQIAVAVRRRVGRRVYLCQAANISVDGMFMAQVRDGLPALPRKCWVEFSLPGTQEVIAARGVVVRQEAHSKFLLTGVRFASIAPSHRRMIEEYVRGPHVAALSPAFLPPGPI